MTFHIPDYIDFDPRLNSMAGQPSRDDTRIEQDKALARQAREIARTGGREAAKVAKDLAVTAAKRA